MQRCEIGTLVVQTGNWTNFYFPIILSNLEVTVRLLLLYWAKRDQVVGVTGYWRFDRPPQSQDSVREPRAMREPRALLTGDVTKRFTELWIKILPIYEYTGCSRLTRFGFEDSASSMEHTLKSLYSPTRVLGYFNGAHWAEQEVLNTSKQANALSFTEPDSFRNVLSCCWIGIKFTWPADGQLLIYKRTF